MELDKNKLLDLYPEYDSVLGPYQRPDNRMHVVLNNSSLSTGTKGKLKTISYPKALVETNIGRTLLPNETVDHDDRNKTNNSLDNLVVRDRRDHVALDVLRVRVEQVACVQCNALFEPSVAQRNSSGSKAGPFCSRRCSGIYGSKVQSGNDKLMRQEIAKTYYRNEK